MQRLVGSVAPQVETFQQPLQLLRADLLDAGTLTRPGELLGLQPLHPQAETVTVPVKHLELGALAIDEHVQRLAEWIEPKLLLDQHRQAIDRLAKVDRRAAQVDLADLKAPVHQRAPCVATASAASHSGAGKQCVSIRTAPTLTTHGAGAIAGMTSSVMNLVTAALALAGMAFSLARQ
jgi:hypothetical protein